MVSQESALARNDSILTFIFLEMVCSECLFGDPEILDRIEWYFTLNGWIGSLYRLLKIKYDSYMQNIQINKGIHGHSTSPIAPITDMKACSNSIMATQLEAISGSTPSGTATGPDG